MNKRLQFDGVEVLVLKKTLALGGYLIVLNHDGLFWKGKV